MEEALMQMTQSRRDFLASASLAAAAGVLGTRGSLADEGPPETTTVRIGKTTSICLAPAYIADELLRAEGFTEIHYLAAAGGPSAAEMVARGEIDLHASFAGTLVYQLDKGLPLTALAGVNVGCYELFAHEPIQTIGDLKGRRVGIQTMASSAHLYLSIIARHIGLDPKSDIEWVTTPKGNAMELFAEGKTDAFLAFPPEPQALRARKVGRMILSTVADQPWSQYICCTLFANRAWVHAHPVAAKRVVRALLKAADLCAAEPENAAQRLVEGGFTKRYDYALQALQEIPYRAWRDYDGEDSMRFYALGLHEAGMIKSSPNALIAEGTDWRFLNELKRELKA
jgi:NitT/TauT family transport system substrate-binding protein